MIDVDQVAPARKLKFYQILYVQVIFAIVVGVLLGAFKPELGQQMQPFGDAFIKLVKMIIAPVIFLTVATGIAAMSDLKKVGRVAGKAMLYFLVFSTLALIVGMIVSHIVQPGGPMYENTICAITEVSRPRSRAVELFLRLLERFHPAQ